MIIVRGTGRPEFAPLLRRLTRSAAQFHDPRVDIELPIVRDVDLTTEQIEHSHLLLWGEPSANSPLSGILEQLPVHARPGGVMLGEQRIDGNDLASVVVYPNPLAPERYLIAYSGDSAPALDSARFLPRFSPDFLVFDERIRQGVLWRRTLRGRPVRAGGFFDDAWGLSEDQSWLEPRPVNQ